MPGAPPDLNLSGAAHDVVGDEGPSAGVAGAELPLPVGDVLHLAVGLHLGDYYVFELLADHPEQPVQIHVEVVQVPLVRAGVVVLFKEGVGQLRDDSVPVDVDDRLVAGLLLDDLEGAPREVLRRDPPDVALPLAEVAEEDEGVPDLLHRSLVLRTDGEAEDVEVCDVAYLVLGEGDSAAEVPRDGEGAVGGTEFPAVEGRPDQGRLELVAVELDGAVAVVPHVRPLDEVGVEDVGDLWRHDGAVELLLELPDLPDYRTVVEHGVQRAAEVGVLGEDLHDRGVGKVEPRIFNHRACEITAEVIEEELIVHRPSNVCA